MNSKQKLILALDVPTFEEARHIIEVLGDTVEIYKVGFQLFTAYGPFIVRYLQAQGKKVFLDLKFHDIPNTVASGVSSAVGLSVPQHEALNAAGGKAGLFAPLFMLTVHTQGGREMMQAAAVAARKRAAELGVARPLVVGVTVLTSDASDGNVSRLVLERAALAQTAGLDGVVSSAQEAAMLRREMGRDFVLVTPGIRLAENDAGDQKRVETPASAIRNGASFLVVGRPIVKAADPRKAAEQILREIETGTH
ncbi:MAG: orotidine-5'-phosphate decarboxylase [Candidatus Omnitrophica bacterium]|nr:orotidine-5'-phosphate decarboxylase [Candidatus Omnitrophota bacterium]